MGIFDIFKNNNGSNRGQKHLDLSRWWVEELTDSDRKTIQSHYQPFGGDEKTIEETGIFLSNQTPLHFLWGLAGWFSKPDVRPLAYKIIEKAEGLIDANSNPLDVHFLYNIKIETKYKDRNSTANGLEEAVKACKQQIEWAAKAAEEFRKHHDWDYLPNHRGYQQLAIVLEKQKDYSGAISTCEQANKQGWAGDWIKRIERCSKKVKSQQS